MVQSYPPEVWKQVRAFYETGVLPRELAKRFGPSRTTIVRRASKEGWNVSARIPKAKAAKEMAASARKILEQYPELDPPKAKKGEKENGLNRQAETSTVEPRIPPESRPDGPINEVVDRESFTQAVAEAATLLAGHQIQVSKAREVANKLLHRIESVVLKGQCEDVLLVKSRQGVEYRLPFLGRNESVSDALIKVSSALQKLIPLERQAHGVKDERTDEMPLTVNFGIAINGEQPVQLVTAAQPESEAEAIEGEAQSIRKTVAHLEG